MCRILIVKLTRVNFQDKSGSDADDDEDDENDHVIYNEYIYV